MQTSMVPAKRSNYPFSVALILAVHLILGYMMYQKVTQTTTASNGTELKQTTKQQGETAIP